MPRCCRLYNFGIRRKEKLVTLVVALAFFFICFGAFLHLPRQEDDSIFSRAYVQLVGRVPGPIKAPKALLTGKL